MSIQILANRRRIFGTLLLTLCFGWVNGQNPIFNPKIASAAPIQEQTSRGYLSGLDWSPDGKSLAVASSLGVWLYDARNFKEQPRLVGTNTNLAAVVFSPDGTLLASVSYFSRSSQNDDVQPGVVEIWDLVNNRLRASIQRALLFGSSSSEQSLAFSPDGKMLAFPSSDPAEGANYIALYDVETGKELVAPEFDRDDETKWYGNHAVAFSPDGATLVGAGDHGVIRIWDVVSGALLAVSRDPWKRYSRPSTPDNTPEPINSLAFSPTQNLLATVGGKAPTDAPESNPDNAIWLWDIKTLRGYAVLHGHSDWVTSVVFSPDGTTLITGSGDTTIRLWQVSTGQTQAILTGHTSAVLSLAINATGTTLASSSWDGTIRLWDLKTLKTTIVLTGFEKYCGPYINSIPC